MKSFRYFVLIIFFNFSALVICDNSNLIVVEDLQIENSTQLGIEHDYTLCTKLAWNDKCVHDHRAKKCLNHGVWSKTSHGLKSMCICLVDYSGRTCNISNAAKNVSLNYEKILNECFLLDLYAQDEVTATGYVLHFSQGKNASYDKLLVKLVGDLWKELSPEAGYLKNFDYNSIFNDKANAGYTIEKLRFYNRYFNRVFDRNFSRLRKVLKALKISFKKSSSYKEMRSNANLFVENWLASNNSFKVFDSNGQKVKNETKTTLSLLSKINGNFDRKKDYNLKSLNLIQHSMITQWDLMIDYGFWYLTNALTYPTYRAKHFKGMKKQKVQIEK
jgi:hypothetical protein